MFARVWWVIEDSDGGSGSINAKLVVDWTNWRRLQTKARIFFWAKMKSQLWPIFLPGVISFEVLLQSVDKENRLVRQLFDPYLPTTWTLMVGIHCSKYVSSYAISVFNQISRNSSFFAHWYPRGSNFWSFLLTDVILALFFIIDRFRKIIVRNWCNIIAARTSARFYTSSHVILRLLIL